MCPGPKPQPITITITATDATPFPPGISDGVLSTEPGDPSDADFTTKVEPNQTVHFKAAGAVVLTKIEEGAGSDIFSQDPTPANSFTGIIGDKLANDDTREYTIHYNVGGTHYKQDPKLNMKR